MAADSKDDFAVTDRNFNPSKETGVDKIKAQAIEFQRVIEANAPRGRRRSLALTHLETATMYAVKSSVAGDG